MWKFGATKFRLSFQTQWITTIPTHRFKPQYKKSETFWRSLIFKFNLWTYKCLNAFWDSMCFSASETNVFPHKQVQVDPVTRMIDTQQKELTYGGYKWLLSIISPREIKIKIMCTFSSTRWFGENMLFLLPYSIQSWPQNEVWCPQNLDFLLKLT